MTPSQVLAEVLISGVIVTVILIVTDALKPDGRR